MNILRSNELFSLPATLWGRFQHWRAMRMFARVVAMKDEAEALHAKACRLIGRNVRPPMPLFDRHDSEGR